jgi:hypothetical protein
MHERRTRPVHLSPIQYVHHPDGRITLEGLPNVTVETILEPGAVPVRDWQQELKLPIFHEEWELMGRPRSLTSGRRIQFVLMDESRTRLPGQPRLQPHRLMALSRMKCPLTLSHTGLVVGTVYTFLLVSDHRVARSLLGMEPPDFTVGHWILSEAELFHSPLADAAWQGLQAQVLTHACAVLLAKPGEAIGGGQLIEVALTPRHYPGCQNARVLKTWEA